MPLPIVPEPITHTFFIVMFVTTLII